MVVLPIVLPDSKCKQVYVILDAVRGTLLSGPYAGKAAAVLVAMMAPFVSNRGLTDAASEGPLAQVVRDAQDARVAVGAAVLAAPAVLDAHLAPQVTAAITSKAMGFCAILDVDPASTT